MNKRRTNSIKGNIDTYILIICLSILFHLHPYDFKPIRFDVVSLSYMFVIYAGYRFGKYWGMACGILSVSFWFIFTLITENEAAIEDILLGTYIKGSSYINYPDLDAFRIFFMSAQSLFIFAFIGYYSGFICDKIEKFLSEKDIKLTDLIPYGTSNFLLSIGEWFEKTSKSLFLLQLNPDDKDGVIKRRLRKMFLILATIPLITLFIALSFKTSYRIDKFNSIYLTPILLSPVLALWLSHRISAKIGIWLSLSLILSPLVFIYYKEYLLIRPLSVSNLALPFSLSVSLAVSAWIIGTVSAQLKDNSLKEKLFPKSTQREPIEHISITHIIVLFLLSVEFMYTSGDIRVYYHSTTLLAFYIVWLSLSYCPKNVSNTIVIAIGITSLFYFVIPSGDNSLHIKLGGISIPEVVYLSIIPYAIKWIKLNTLRNARALSLGLFTSLSLLLMIFSYHDSSVVPDILISFRQKSILFPILSLSLMFLFSEIFARLIWLSPHCSKQPPPIAP